MAIQHALSTYQKWPLTVSIYACIYSAHKIYSTWCTLSSVTASPYIICKCAINSKGNTTITKTSAKTKTNYIHSCSMKTKHVLKKYVRKPRGKQHESRRLFWLDLERTDQKHPKARRHSWNRQTKTENKRMAIEL